VILATAFASGQAVTRCGGPNNALYINWPTFGFDVCHTGYNPYEYRINPGNVQDLVVAWQYGPGGFNSPVLANGVVYFGGANVYALDSRTGALLWTYSTGSEVQNYPTVFNNVLYVGSGQAVYALDAKAGTLLWEYSSATGAIETGTTVADGVVYVGSWDNSKYTILALDAKTGVLRWQRTPGNWATPTVVNGIVYFGTSTEMYALNAVSGAVVWHASLGGVANGAVAVFNNVVYVSTNAGLYALNALTGAILWNGQPQTGVFTSSPVVGAGAVYVGAQTSRQSPGPEVYSFNAANGALLWSSSTPTTYGAVNYLALANGVLYASSGGVTDYLVAYSSADGSSLWEYQNAAGSAYIIANGMLYVPSWDTNYFYAFHQPNQ